MRPNESCCCLIIVLSENLKLIHVYRTASCECIWVERQNPSYLFQCLSVTQIHVLQGPLPRLSHSVTTCSLHTHCGQNHGMWTGHKTVCVLCLHMCVCICLRAATAEPALVQTLGSQRICSWWSQTFLPWRRAAGTARYQTSYCEKEVSGYVVMVLL